MTALAPRVAYALWAPTYAAETAVSALERHTVDALGVVVAGRRVLDVGCGIARRLADARRAGATLALGLDLVPGMLAAAAPAALLAAADVRALPVADAAFDVVWCRLVLGHLPSLGRAYAELARVCAPGGRIVVSDFHPAASAAGHRRTFRDAAGARHEVEHHAHAVRAHRAAAAHAGLSVVGRRDGVVDDSIRDYYERAGLGERHERDRNLPLVLALALALARAR